ncbi:hypothetical protein [Thiohalorhabdus sp.]|uniref:hypothetical protein n=1 Tax=Thiohalorhabdus sp. TaxID=3094134 RepID=UPI002FC28933
MPFEAVGLSQEVRNKLDRLQKLPRVRLQACNLALRRQGRADKPLLPGIEKVTNDFIAMAGYGAQSYTRIPVD